jgi:RNA polymerase sigma-70 factor (ECF subfamily)
MLEQAAELVVEEAGMEAPEAFSQLLREHQRMVFSLAYHFLHDAALAEEVSQDVFLELHGRLGALESPAHIRHWLRRVTAHRSIDQSRRRKARPQVGLDEVPEPSSPPAVGDPLRDGLLRRLVAALPEKPRMVVVLRYQEDLDPAEIAEVLSMPVRTVKSHLQRSLDMLRRKMERMDGEARI